MSDTRYTLRDGLFRLGRIEEKVDDLNSLLRTIIEECKHILECEAASVALYDAEHGDLVFTVASGGDEKSITQWRMKMGQGVVGYVAETRQSIFANDPQHDTHWFSAVDKSSGFVTHNIAAVPMVHSDRLVGVVEALNRMNRGFEEEDLVVLQIFADQAAMALEINRLIEARRQDERMAAFGVALADIGHSAKNMLMRLEFPIEVIDRCLARGNIEGAQKSWGVMKEATTEIGQLVRDMLNYSKPREPEIMNLNVAELARAVLDECRPDATAKDIDLTLQGVNGELKWSLDPQTVAPALHNLVGNAIEAIAEKGGSSIVVHLSVAGEPEELRVAVIDDGPGIPAEIQRRIFDPFFSTKGKRGTGLGLANVRKGMEEHSGRVTLVSEPGMTKFTLVFPRTK